MSDNSRKSFFADLWERRVPQFLATYIGISWGITQFLIFASNRYGLDSSVIDKFLLFVLIFLPSVMMFTYNHGRPGRDVWTKKEKLIIPFNLLLAIGIASFAGKGNTIQAAPSEVMITTEEGDTITRLVPAISQTKSFAVFPFKNVSGNAEDHWMRFAIPQLISTDLEQDIRLYCMTPFGMEYQYGSVNYKLTDDIPFSTKLKISKNKIAQYFIDGEFQKNNDNYTADIKVIETKTGEEFFSQQYTHTDLYQIVDDFNKALSDNLFLKDATGDLLEVIDLPARDLISSDVEALKSFCRSIMESQLSNNYESALSYAIKAGEIDANSAEIKKLIASSIYNKGDMKSAQMYMKEALHLSEDLSERQKLNLKATYYIYHQEVDKAIRLWETWRTLYPRDYYPFTKLMEFYTITRNFAKAKAVGDEAIKSGHKNRILKRMANVCIQRDELEEAEKYLLEYLELFPDKAKNDTQLAEIYESKGQLKKAESYLEKIELLNPGDHNILVKLSNVYQLQGQYDKAESYLNKAYENATLVQDSVEVIFQKMMFYLKTADSEKFRQIAKKRIELMESYTSKMVVASTSLQLTGFYAQFGMEDDILQYLDEVVNEAPQVEFTFDCITGFIISLIQEDLEGFKASYQSPCKELLTNSNKELDYIAQGLMAKMEGNNKDAIRFIELYIDSTGTGGKEYGSMLAEAYRKSGDFDSAIKACEDYLSKDKAHPFFLLELCLAQFESGKIQEAKKNYDVLKNIWTDMDSNYVYYERYNSLKEAMESE